MKITKLDIKDFGKFSGDYVFDDIDERIALFYGKNEAGKTTIFNLIKALFYGFYPATCDSHPYASWKNGGIEFTAHMLNGAGDQIVVNRKLMSTPKGKCMIGDNYINLRNKTLPWAEHISCEIFDKIYSLRVEDLIEIQGKAWDEVEDKLLANYGTENIKNTRDVLKEIKKECDDIWRESNRGKFLIKELKNQVKELKKTRKDIIKKEEEVRELDNKIDSLSTSIDILKDEKYKIKTKLTKSRELKPIKDILEDISSQEEKVVNTDTGFSMPDNIRESFEELNSKLNELEKEKERKNLILERKKRELYIFSDLDEVILSNKVKINAFLKNYSEIQRLRLSIASLEDSIERIKGKLLHEGDNILKEQWKDDMRQSFESISKVDLQMLVNKLKKTKEKLKEMKWKRDLSVNGVIEVKFSKAYIFSIIFGSILISGGFLVDSSILYVFGLGGVFYGLTGIMNYRSMKNKYESSLDKKNDINIINKNIERLERDMKETKERLANYLKGIPISNLIIEDMDELFLPNMLKIMDTIYELNEMERKLLKIELEYETAYEEYQDFISGFYFEEYLKEEEKLIYLKEMSEELERKKLSNDELIRDIEEIEREANLILERIQELSTKHARYKNILEKIGNEDIDKGLEILEENQRIQNRIDGLREKLNEYDNVDFLIEEINKCEEDRQWLLNDYNISKTEDELDEISKSINALEIEKARAEETLKQSGEYITLDEIESKIFNLEDEIMAAYEKRDRLALLSEIIRLSDQKFREENQPDVLKNASKYFNIMTKGRYTDLFIEDNGEERGIMVKREDDTMPIKVVETFSKGTLNQLYLSLRLSLIDHLDRNNEYLPISLDELLVNWDESRLDNSLNLLSEISKKRQVFIFTCHEWMARKIEGKFSINRKIIS